MVKGISIRLKSYEETVPKILELIKLDKELKKHSKIILKPSLKNSESKNTPASFVESVLKFCIQHKNPATEVYIAEGSDGEETADLFNNLGYRELAERYSVGLIDLNDTETEEIKSEFMRFNSIHYPTILLDGFVISLPVLSTDQETEVAASLSNMLGAFPASHYSGFFSSTKSKIRKWPIKYSIYDIIKCKVPELAIIDASEQGLVFAGQPVEMDKQAAKLIGFEISEVPYLGLIEEDYVESPSIGQQ